ncbi:hypothetical protein EKO27_g2064 [Xylaria grammica]|uniref:Tubulin-specific chaperone A n=1 Tax=Xylaria grammica TaxID=363999 RepID=A0A439DF67_9PEZI|nr:hypothetical protein EKO27_g2064 [Xylaria grammica]
MPAPSPLAIATQSVQRLVKEDSYYRKELAQQTERVKKLEADLKASSDSADGNEAYILKQEVRSLYARFIQQPVAITSIPANLHPRPKRLEYAVLQKAIEETRAVFAPLHERIVEAVQRLEERIATAESEGAAADEITKANEALKLGREIEPPVA